MARNSVAFGQSGLVSSVGSLVLGAALVAAAPAQAVVIDRFLDPNFHSTRVAAYAGWTAWSRYSPATRRYRLVVRHAGQNRQLPIAGRRVAFDVSLGPGAAGHPTAVFSRCSREGDLLSTYEGIWYAGGRGCRIYRYDLRTDQLRSVPTARPRSGSDYLPAIWRDRLAFGRTVLHGGHRVRAVRVIDLGSGRVLATRQGSRVEHARGATSVALRRTTLAFTWLDQAPGDVETHPKCFDERGGSGTHYEVWRGQFGPPRFRRLMAGCFTYLLDVSFSRNGLAYRGDGNLQIDQPGKPHRTYGLPDYTYSIAVDGNRVVSAQGDRDTPDADLVILETPLGELSQP